MIAPPWLARAWRVDDELVRLVVLVLGIGLLYGLVLATPACGYGDKMEDIAASTERLTDEMAATRETAAMIATQMAVELAAVRQALRDGTVAIDDVNAHLDMIEQGALTLRDTLAPTQGGPP